MKSTSKKGSQKSSRKSRSRPLRKRLAAPKKTSGLEGQIAALKREVAEGLEQQTATSEILRVIASSPSDLQPVLDSVAENAARLCNALDALVVLVDGNVFRIIARFSSLGPMPVAGMRLPLTRGRLLLQSFSDFPL